MIEIDGGFREGGGQILRTALSLSSMLRKPFRIYDIRRRRRKPGIMPQHLTSVRAAKMITHAHVTGDVVGSCELSFSPGEVRSGSYTFDVGTAGSTSLVLQTIIPALTFRGTEKSTARLTGGTHVPFSPCYHYLERVFSPILRIIGVHLTLTIRSYGFYPQGGGVIEAEMHPVGNIHPVSMKDGGSLSEMRGFSGVGNLPLSIAERQKTSLMSTLEPFMKSTECPIGVELLNVLTPGRGSFLFLYAESDKFAAGFTSWGEKGKRAERVGQEAAENFLAYHATGASLDPYLSDQIVLYLAMCAEESVFSTSEISEHLLTNLWVIGLFHRYSYEIEGKIGEPGTVRIHAAGNALSGR